MTEDICASGGGISRIDHFICDDEVCADYCESDNDCDASGGCDALIRRCFECRPEEDTCPGDLICDGERRVCEPVLCEAHESCPDGMYCDLLTGMCKEGCRGDEFEGALGNNTAEDAFTTLDETYPISGNICAGDEDWFSFGMGCNDGLLIELTVAPNEAPMIIDIYSESGLVHGLDNPSYRVDSPENRRDSDVYTLEIYESGGEFIDGIYFLRVRAAEPDETIGAYELDIRFIRTCGCLCPDNSADDLMSAISLEAALGLDGLLPYDAPQGLEGLRSCPGDHDFFAVELEEGDVIEAWVVGDVDVGYLTVEIRDDQGTQVGRSAEVSFDEDWPDLAVLRGARAGRYYIHVENPTPMLGLYTLFVQRRMTCGCMCGEDVIELELERDDTHLTARALEDVSDGEGLRFEHGEGYLCDVDGPDEDWYRVPVGEAPARVCVTVSGFQHEQSDVSVELYPSSPSEGAPCQDDAFCLQPGSCGTPNNPQYACGGFCIEGVCAGPLAVSKGLSNLEMIHISEDTAGDRLLRVSREGGDAAYRVTATVTPEAQACAPDWRERFDDYVPFNEEGFCDVWLCRDDFEDNYEITIPAGEDRTVIVSYDNDDELILGLHDPSIPDYAFYYESNSGLNTQCINIRSADVDQSIYLMVYDGSQNNADRTHYSIRAIRSDLSSGFDGVCASLGAAPLEACPADPAHPNHLGLDAPCYPSVTLTQP